jgi:YHS domain-containing protein
MYLKYFQLFCDLATISISLLLYLFCSLPALAVTTPDPLQQLVNTQSSPQVLKYSPTFEGRGDGIVTCPVSGEKVTTKSLKAELFGRTVYFCCEGCLKSAERSPERYVKPTRAEQEQAVKAYIAKVPQAPSGEEYCNE